MIAAIVQPELLLRVLYTALAAGITVSVSMALAVYGVGRSSERRREGRTIAATAYALLGSIGLASSTALVVFGIVLLSRKS
jgi:hypothetical protein